MLWVVIIPSTSTLPRQSALFIQPSPPKGFGPQGMPVGSVPQRPSTQTWVGAQGVAGQAVRVLGRQTLPLERAQYSSELQSMSVLQPLAQRPSTQVLPGEQGIDV